MERMQIDKIRRFFGEGGGKFDVGVVSSLAYDPMVYTDDHMIYPYIDA